MWCLLLGKFYKYFNSGVFLYVKVLNLSGYIEKNKGFFFIRELWKEFSGALYSPLMILVGKFTEFLYPFFPLQVITKESLLAAQVKHLVYITHNPLFFY